LYQFNVSFFFFNVTIRLHWITLLLTIQEERSVGSAHS